MKWSELPKEYRDLEIPKNSHDFWRQCCQAKTIDQLPPLPNTLSKEAQKHLDNALQSSKKQAYGYKGDILVDNIEKEFALPEKWCVRGYTNDNIHKWFNERLKREIATSVINYFHYPEIELNVCTSCAISSGYTEITYDQWVKYVKIKEMRDAVNSFKKGGEVAGVKLDSKEEIINREPYILENPFQKQYAYCRHDLQDISQRDIDATLSNQETLEPFYMIYVDGASGSTRKHDKNSAIIEAQRLSKETDKKVFILRSNNYFERNIEIKNTILK